MNRSVHLGVALLAALLPAAAPGVRAQSVPGGSPEAPAGSAPPAGAAAPRPIDEARALIASGRPLDAAALLEPLVAADADRPFAWLTLGEAYRRARVWDKAIAADTKAAGFEDVHADAAYNLACDLALAGRKGEALDALASAAAAGFADAAKARADEDLAALRADPRFATILAAMTADPASVGPRAGPGDPSAILQGDLGQRLDRAVLDSGAEGFSGDVLVQRSGQALLHKGYGLADRAGCVPITKDTVFAIGSIAKSFTAAAILLLEQDGKLRVEDALGKLLDGVPADKAAITIHQLLTHSAGLDDYVDRPGEGGDFAPVSRAEMLHRVLGGALLFPPGSQSRYSNAGYCVLAAIIERVAGVPYPQFIRTRVLEPAGLQHSGFFGDRDRWKDAQVALGYGLRTQGGERSPARWPAPQWALMGGGGLVSTTEDLAHFVAALHGGKLLTPASQAKAFAGAFPLEGGGSEGYGWIVGKPPGGETQIAVAGGDDLGFNAVIRHFPESDTLVVITCNAARGPDACQPVMRALLEALAR